VHFNSHLGVITLETMSDSGILVERMLRVRHKTCQWNQETGETTVQAEIVSSRSGCLEARIGFDLPENSLAEARAREKAKKQVIRAQMTGKVLQVLVEPGTMVTPETPLVVIEAMKMENRVFAARSGTVTTVAVKSGDLIQSGRELLVIDAS
jgi:biotin carboxyl carrier protein